MAKVSMFNVKVDVNEIEALADRLGAIDAQGLSHVIVDTLNQVGEETFVLARRRMTAQINLSEEYVGSRMVFNKATTSGRVPSAEIIAKGQNTFLTGLGHYGALQESREARWSMEDGKAKGYNIGPWPKWEERKGDPGRGIDSGEKQAGVSVEVTRGSRKMMGNAFTIPGKKHSDGSPVVFVGKGVPGKGVMDRKRRESRQAVRALYGPSVYQLFRAAASDLSDDVTDNLEQAIVAGVEYEITKAFK